MNILGLKQMFMDRLKYTYPKEESESFFFMLTEHYLDRSRLDLALDNDAEVTMDIFKKFESAVDRLTHHEPIQYIIGSTEFFGLKFMVDNNVLIPRPETEELVKWIIDDVKMRKEWVNPSIIDIGTGSGCIAVTLARYIDHAMIDAVDISEEALKLAQKNCSENLVEVNLSREDILQVESLNRNYDIIVSNPPYVTLSDKVKMQANVVDHEPAMALFVPEDDPLIFYKRILKLGRSNLNANGCVYFEINEYLSEDLFNLKEIEFYSTIELRKDIFGKDRMIKCCINE
jgi:release factor glutamine methyltransferase